MKLHHALLAGAFVGVLVPAILFARTLDPAFRQCMRTAVDTYHSVIIDSQRTYDDELESAMEERKQSYLDSWNNEDDKVQRQIQHDADKQYSRRVSDARKAQRDRDRTASKAYSDAQRSCKNAQSSSSSSRSSSSSSRSSSSRSYSSSHHQCDDIVCNDGRRFPTCRDNGVINYYINPCLR